MKLKLSIQPCLVIFLVTISLLPKTVYSEVLLKIYINDFEPFISKNDNKIEGPYLDAFKQLAMNSRLKYEFEFVPTKRALSEIEKKKNHCILAANYDPGIAETSLYVSRISKIVVWAYGRKSKEELRVNNLSDFAKHTIGVIDISEVHDILSQENISKFETIKHRSSGLEMLQANRFEILITDIDITSENTNTSKKVFKLFPILTAERWFICNSETDFETIRLLKSMLKEGLFASSVKNVWVKYGLKNLYESSRKEMVSKKENK